jgi:phage-related minor tail protein
MTDANLTSSEADLKALDMAMTSLEARSKSFGSALGSALKSATVDGKGLDDVLKGLGQRLIDMSLNAGMKPLETLVNTSLSGMTSSLTSLFGFANGGVPGKVQPFAAGGVVSSPTFFPMGADFGLMGEAGSEAILPLKRGADGKLGVAAGGQGSSQQIIFNVQAQDAASFKKSEGQISAMLTRAAMRGKRGL